VFIALFTEPEKYYKIRSLFNMFSIEYLPSSAAKRGTAGAGWPSFCGSGENET
jgi:hypothetical protein